MWGRVFVMKLFLVFCNVTEKTVKKMLDLLESFYFIFKVLPYYKNISKSIRKSPKYYFYDIAQVKKHRSKI